MNNNQTTPSASAQHQKPASAEIAYRQSVRIIEATVNAFKKRYGGRRDDLLSEAHLYFAIAYDTYDPERIGRNGETAAFTTHVRNKVWYGLLTELRRKMDYCQKFPRERYNLKTLLSRPEHDPTRPDQCLVNEVSKDAVLVMRLAMVNRARARPQKARSKVIEFLRDLGWAGARIIEAFKEIREALR